jgi:hypothetical protein
MRFAPLQHVKNAGSTINTPGLPRPVRSAYRVSHPLDGLLPRTPSGLVSCRKRSWGCPLQSFSLQPGRSASRRPQPSCRWQRGAATASIWRGMAGRYALPNDQSLIRRQPRRLRAARLQGVALGGSPCSPAWCEPRREIDALLGFRPLQGISLSEPGTDASNHPPPMGFLASSSLLLRGAAR